MTYDIIIANTVLLLMTNHVMAAGLGPQDQRLRQLFCQMFGDECLEHRLHREQ